MDKQGYHIFIAEDEPIVLMGFEALVRICGHTVAGTASDGAKALERIRELKPDIMILDIDMPEVDGLSVAETIYQELKIPGIIVTGYRSSEYAERAGKSGVYAYLQKPVDEFEMRSAINIAMNQHALQMQTDRARMRAETAARKEKRARIQAETEKEQAEQKLRDRVVIERAKGLLMDQFGLGDEQAMKALQKKSADTNTKLAEVARQMLQAADLLK